MHKRFIRLLCIIVTLFIVFAFAACNGKDGKEETAGGGNTEDTISDGETPSPKPDDFKITVSATAEKINITMRGQTEKLVGSYKVVELKPYEYFEGEDRGMSEIISAGKEVGDYTAGTDAVVSIDRYGATADGNAAKGFDNVYCKYYLVKDGKPAYGPVYATEIAAEFTGEPAYMEEITSKKGLADNALRFNQIRQDGETARAVLGAAAPSGEVVGDKLGLITLKDLGCRHVGISYVTKGSFDEPGMFVASEGDETVGTPSERVENTCDFVYNGKTYKFNMDYVSLLDEQVEEYSKAGLDITAEIDLWPEDGLPYDLTYAKYGGYGLPNTRFAGINTSNAAGFGYWGAAVEFLASRYSGGEGSKGYISAYVIGNEIDYSYDYFCIAREHRDIDTYVEEYCRALRTANTAVKKYNSNIEVVVTFTHAWANAGHTSNDNTRNYAVKDLIDKLNAKTKAQGDFNWGIGPHCYGFSLASSRVFEYDTSCGKAIEVNTDNGSHINFPGGTVAETVSMTGDYNTSDSLTFSNLEMIDQYLNREEMKCNGKVRNVYLQEPGVSSSGYFGDLNDLSYKTTDGSGLAEAIQAAVIAAAYYKVSQLDCIKVYEYFVPIDSSEANFMPGLMLERPGQCAYKKPAYYLWKYIDTQYSYQVSGFYLPYLTYYDIHGNFMTYGNGINSYRDVLDIFGTGYDFSRFDNSKAMPRKIEGGVESFGFTLPAADMKPVRFASGGEE